MNKTAKELDQFYTKKEIALKVFQVFKGKVSITNDTLFIEPAAGAGVFLDILEKDNRSYEAYDIDPKDKRIKKVNFLERLELFDEKTVFIGNPPFGKKSKLAIDFINTPLKKGAETIGYILPIQFRKWGVQNRIDKRAALIHDEILPEESFTLEGKKVSLRTVFQIWTTNKELKGKYEDTRIKKAPKTKHEDFEMWQYNRTKQAERFFDYDWDFAVVRQGYYDYNEKIFKKEDCNKKRQYIFFKAKDKETLLKLLKINFDKLSKKNTTIYGFGKADVIIEYEDKYE